MEVVSQRVVTCSNQIDFIANDIRNSTWHLDNQRVLSDETGVQDGLLVVEVDLLDAGQVGTYQTDICLRIGLYEQ